MKPNRAYNPVDLAGDTDVPRRPKNDEDTERLSAIVPMQLKRDAEYTARVFAAARAADITLTDVLVMVLERCLPALKAQAEAEFEARQAGAPPEASASE
jgi:hypothetical protein